VKSTRNGRCTRKLRIATSSVGGCFAIVSCRQLGQRLNAENVSAICLKTSACTAATGATWADVSPICLKNSLSRVRGSDRFVITGVRKWKNGLSPWIAAFRSWPRPANASP
jgi:hypothetical protein